MAEFIIHEHMLHHHLGICLKVQKEKNAVSRVPARPYLPCCQHCISQPSGEQASDCWLGVMLDVFKLYGFNLQYTKLVVCTASCDFKEPLHLFPRVLASPIRIPFSLGICLPLSGSPSTEPLH